MSLIIGPTQKKTLELLAVNPNLSARAIQRAIGLPDCNYSTVWLGLQGLQKMGFVDHKVGLSKKKVPIKYWFLTTKGLSFVLGYLDLSPEDTMKALYAYTVESDDRELLQAFERGFGKEGAARLFKSYLALVNTMRQDPEFVGVGGLAFLSELRKQTVLSKLDQRKKDKRLHKIQVLLEQILEVDPNMARLYKTLLKQYGKKQETQTEK